MRRKLVAGNWKMHGSLEQNKALLDALVSGVTQSEMSECAVCVPFPYLCQAQMELVGSPIKWGAQDVHPLHQGAYTGEVSAKMLLDFGCQYVIVGHSERRTLYGESNELVAEKFAAAHASGLIPILCVGETLEQRENGVTEQIISKQLDAVLSLVGEHSLDNAVIAYEPVWAIGTGKTASPEQAQHVHLFIRQRLAERDAQLANKMRILYGGSVKAANAVELFGMPDIDGGLIGGASLIAEDFLAICRAAK
ncbi:MAG: triose-phosphate isomerase [Nitrosomonadales bacterium]|nr:triose-phosphate isomerase [Nitrosomonadales bacterium]